MWSSCSDGAWGVAVQSEGGVRRAWRRAQCEQLDQVQASSITASYAATSAFSCSSSGFFARSAFACVAALRYDLHTEAICELICWARFGPPVGVNADAAAGAAGAAVGATASVFWSSQASSPRTATVARTGNGGR